MKVSIGMDRINLRLNGLTCDQETAIKELFESHGWDYALQVSYSSDRESSDVTYAADHLSLVDSSTTEFASSAVDSEADSGGPTVAGVSDAGSGAGVDVTGSSGQGESDGFGTQECGFCFCSPCVTDARQQWLGHGQKAHKRNSGIRKRLYRKYWCMLNTRGAWRHPLYLRKKSDMMCRDRVDDSVVQVLRDIMPDCVLQLVRDLYPNPHGTPYLGHKWW